MFDDLLIYRQKDKRVYNDLSILSTELNADLSI
jgi:hypothetical protein